MEITLSNSECQQLERWNRRYQTPWSLAERTQIVLLPAQGLRNDAIRERLGFRRARVCKWRRRLAERNCAGLSDQPRPRQLVKYGAEQEKRLLARLDSPPPGYGGWNSRLLAQALGVPAGWVWEALRRHEISLQRRGSW